MLRSGPLHLILTAVALAAIALPLLIVTRVPATVQQPAVANPQRALATPARLPPVEPVTLQQVDPEDARAINAAVPFAKGPVAPARPFRFVGSPDDRARAIDCLAAAVLYEAGDDPPGQQAVAQVVLNRLRHPAFPKTICGVVFQGSERSTGCQFTFTCDGALARIPPAGAWQRARRVAEKALGGTIARKVGLATHYHTDWVVPYWSASLDKVAAVDTHLFFRWSGWWGTSPAFNRNWAGPEPAVAAIAFLSDAHRRAPAALPGAVVAGAPWTGALPPAISGHPDVFLTTLDRAKAESFVALALGACGDRPQCRLMGWTDRTRMGRALPLSDEQMAAMSFSYIRDRAAGLDRALWNCDQFPGRKPCMKRQLLRAVPVQPAAPAPAPTRGPEELSGVRRKHAPPQPSPENAAAPE